MKKGLLTVALLGCLTAGANTYNVIIDKTNNNYVVGISYTETVEYSEWTDMNTHSCVDNVDANDYYYGVSFSQTSDCKEDQERTKTYSDGRDDVVEYTTETQTIDVVKNTTDTGTHLEDSCKNILNNGFSSVNKVYTIETTDAPFEVVCDMTTDGAGWTLLQSGTINQNTTDADMIAYNIRYTGEGHEPLDYIDKEKPYLLRYEDRHTVSFNEFKVLHEGETGTYKNHLVSSNTLNTSMSATTLSSKSISSYKVSHSYLNGHSNFYNLNNCSFSSGYKGHISCEHGKIDIFSYGADGQEGGEGVNKDIGNWNLNE